MLRHPVMINSLEEDFKKLGLLSEEGEPSAPQKDAPAGEPATNKASKSRNVGSMSDDPSNKGEDGTDEAPDHQSASEAPPKKSIPVVPGAQSEAIVGEPDPIRAGKNVGKAKPAQESEEDDDEDEKDDDEIEKEESVELEGSALVSEAIRNIREGRSSRSGRRHQHESRQMNEGNFDKVTSLIEDVNAIMDSIDDARRSDAVKAFANTAIIADMLSRGFAQFAESYESEQLGQTADAFTALAQDAALVAEALEEGEEVDPDALQEEFQAQMKGLIEGLDLYSDVVEHNVDEATAIEDDESDDEEDDDEDDKEKSKKGDDKDDDEDGEEEKDEAVQAEALPSSPLVKRRGQKGGIGASGVARSRWATGGIVSSKSEASLPFGKKMVNRPKMPKMKEKKAGY